MSFGVSIGDIIKVISLLLTTFKDCKSAPTDLAHATHDAEGLELVLKSLSEEIKDSESPLQRDDILQRSLDATIQNCKSVLIQLQKILIKFKDAPESRLHLRDRLRVPKQELLEIRSKLSSHKSTLAAALHVTGLRALRTFAGSVDEKLGKMLSTMTKFGDTHRADQAKSSSALSEYSHDEASVWAAFRRELIKDGMRSSDITRYKSDLKTHLQMLMDKNLVVVEVPMRSESRSLVLEDNEACDDASSDDATVTLESDSQVPSHTGRWDAKSISGSSADDQKLSPISRKRNISKPQRAAESGPGSLTARFSPSLTFSGTSTQFAQPVVLSRHITPEYLADYIGGDDDDKDVEIPKIATDGSNPKPLFARVWLNILIAYVLRAWKWLFKKSYHVDDLYNAASSGNKKEVSRLISKGCFLDAQHAESGMTALHAAILGGHRSIVAILIDSGASAEIKDQDSDTALHYAVIGGFDWAVDMLLLRSSRPRRLKEFFLRKSRFVDVDAVNVEGCTALLLAVQDGNRSSVESLISHGADLDAASDDGMTPVLTAIREEYANILSYLLDKGADIELRMDGKTPLLDAIIWGSHRSEKILLKCGADVAAHWNGETALMLAVECGHLETVTLILEKMSGPSGRGDINATYNGMTALITAILQGRRKIVAVLLENNANPDLPVEIGMQEDPHRGFTPLLIATKRSRLDILIALLNGGASVNLAYKGWTSLTLAACSGDHEIVTFLLEHGADIEAVITESEMTAIHCAARDGHLQTVKILVDKGANIEAISLQGSTPLLLAALCGQHTTVAYLLEIGANVNAKNSEMYTPLHFAIKSGREETVLLLLEKGANIAARSKSGRGPLHEAAHGQNHRIIKLLIDNEAELEAQTASDGFTALHEAVVKGMGQVVTLLVENRANIESRVYRHGATPLHLAVEKDLTAMVSLLLKHGANIEATLEVMNGTETPLHTAVRLGNSAVIDILLENKADTDTRGVYGETPLHMAASSGRTALVSKLLEFGAKIDLKENGGRTPLYLSCAHQHVANVAFLLDKGADPNTPTVNSTTPLSKTMSFRNLDIIQELLKYNVQVDDNQKPIIRKLMTEKRGSVFSSGVHDLREFAGTD